MADRRKTPYLCHVLVCTNDRKGMRKSCADGNSIEIRAMLKKQIADRGWKPDVRLSQSGCLGLCAKGPNVILYPQKIWFSQVTAEEVPSIMKSIAEIVEDA